ncbi:MAG: AAA family ATPase [Candidatus Competibacteraceae bacterium]|nr:MAG: AAA family ATPase [Candidatus Competibacteraceae bacterium]
MDIRATSLEEVARRVGLVGIREFADDLHVAAEWRNNRVRHPRTIALASGYNAGVHTLSHYARPLSADLARTLLEDAREKLPVRAPGSPEVHRQLLYEILVAPELESLLSLEACAEYLARWDALRPEQGNRAPWLALPALGLLVDENLFGPDHVSKRLALNLATVRQVKTLRASDLRVRARRHYQNPARQAEMTEAVVAVESYMDAIQRGVEDTLSLAKALVVARPPKDEPEEDKNLPTPDPTPDPNPSDPPSLADESSDALLDGRDEDLAAIADAIDEAWTAFDEAPSEDIEIPVTLPSSQREVTGTTTVDRKVLDWVQAFCSQENWGGFLDTSETFLPVALAGAADRSPVFVHPDRVVTIEGEALSLEALLAAWDEDLPGLIGRHTQLAATWRAFQTLRTGLLPHLGKLIYHARSWLDGRPEILTQVRRYLELAATLYRETQENYRVMASSSPDWARSALEALLALDIVQLRVHLPNGKLAAKAVLLPTHPLYLWRNERLSTLLRGLTKSTSLDAGDREVVRRELERPEQFLSVVRLGSLPAGYGLNQLLPLASQVEGLPVFENLINACSGADGARALHQALDQYIILHPNHPYPLRVALINPPQPENLMMELVRLLNDPRYRGGQKLAAVDAAIYATGQHADRLRAALSFSNTRKEDEVQEKIAADRLHLHLDETCLSDEPPHLGDIVNRIKARPCHVAAIFDESTIRLRQRGAGQNLPMSPFCIRYDVQLDRRSGRIELRPQPGESPFSEFLLLMNELEGNQRDVTPHAYADAEALAQTADEILQGDHPAARWLFLADRALPSEAGMQSVRIWERREGMRDTFLAARDFGALARLIRPVFAHPLNLTVTPEHMSRLLHQGARLLGSGVLDIIRKQDGQPDQKKVIGFAGLLFAARDLQRRYPGALVLSVDHPLARLWLRTGKRALENRCDLLVLWKDETAAAFHLIAVEVKASNNDQIEIARLAHAVEQIGNTLEAVEDGLAAASLQPRSPLSIPRCEMLKQTLARAAQARSSDGAMDRANRLRWGGWLMELFAVEAGKMPHVQVSGDVISVLLRREAVGVAESLKPALQWPVIHRILGLPEVDNLLNWEPAAPTAITPARPVSAIETTAASESSPASAVPDPVSLPEEFSAQPLTSPSAPVPDRVQMAAAPIAPSNPATGQIWPPPVNALGMIGQYQAVDLLVKQAQLSKALGERFPDKLLVGPAGVGKSTLARSIGALLLNREPLFFSGSDLRRPSDLLERLTQEELVPAASGVGTIRIEPCLIFIDEVHGISASVATALLSAMDDRRITSIEGGLYDFNRVVFLLATTDQGKLSEAFQSRPNKTWLRSYTLHELAGIIWLHGKDCLDNAELSREACYEIAARARCNPRRSVRDLSEALRPHFFHCAGQQMDGTPSLRQAAELMIPENIAAFYESQGIDYNGLDDVARRFLHYLKQHGAVSEATLSQALGLTHRQDFVETAEYLVRLGLIETSSAGRSLTREGKRYLNSSPPPDLRSRISRAM